MSAKDPPAGATLIKRTQAVIDRTKRRIQGNFQRAAGQSKGWGRYWPLEGLACLTITASLTALLVRYFPFSFVKHWACVAFSIEPVLFWLLLGGSIILAIQPVCRFLRRMWRAFRSGLLNRSAWVIVGLICGVCQGFTAIAWVAVVWLVGAAVLAFVALLAVPHRQGDHESMAFQVESDVPITTEDEDYLGRSPFVEVLAREALSGPNSVIALVGELGAGKSSALHLLKRKLETSPESPVIVDFKAWLPSSGDALVSDLLRSIETEIRQQFWWPALSGAVRGFMRTISIKGGGAEARIGNWFEDKSQRQRLMELDDVANAFPRRVIVLVDEIDRMDRPELHELFKILRGVPELKNICFVCALDLNAVADTLSNGKGKDRALAAARRYTEKFFTTRFYLPFPSDEKISEYVSKQLTHICSDPTLEGGKESLLETMRYIEPDWQAYRLVFRTPRLVKIILNSMKHMSETSSNKLNPKDLLCLVAVWTFDLSIITLMREYQEYFAQEEWSDLTNPLIGISRRNDPETKKSERESFFDARLGKLRDVGDGPVILRLLAAMFPHVDEWFKGKYTRGSSAWVSKEEYEKSFRIAHPRFFLQYFTMVVPGSQFAEAEFEELVSRLQGMTKEEVTSEVVTLVIAIEPRSLKCFDFFLSLGAALDRLPDPALMGVVDALSILAPELEEGMLGFGTRAQARSIIFMIAKRMKAGADGQEILRYVISSTPDEAFAARILFSCTHKDRNEIITDWSGINVTSLESAFVSRLRERYRPEGTISLFDKGMEYCLMVLFRWVECGPEALNDEVAYLDWEFGRDQKNLGRFAGWMATQGRSSSDRLEWMRKLYPNLSQLVAQYEQFEDSAPGSTYSTPNEHSALEELCRLLGQFSPSGGSPGTGEGEIS